MYVTFNSVTADWNVLNNVLFFKLLDLKQVRQNVIGY